MGGGLTRRQLVGAGAAAGAGLVLPWRPGWVRAAVPQASGAAFAHGIAAGQPRIDGATLWTRLEGLSGDARLRLEVARDPGFADVVLSQGLTARADADFTARRRIRGLAAGERYWYRFATTDTDSPVGTFVTARPADSQEPVRIGFFSCQRYTDGWFTAHAALAQEEDVDLIVSLGDYVYWSAGPPALPQRTDPTGVGGDVETLDEYRAKYRLYQADPDLQAMQASAALVSIWDDNDVENNYAGDTPGTDGARRVPWPQRRANAYRAALEHLPVVPRRDDPERIYGALRLGGMAELLLLDTRRYRDDQACADQAGVPCLDAKLPGRTMLGQAQKRWLERRLVKSSAAWKVIANQVMMMSLDSAPFVQLNQDQWDGYDAERRELMEHLVKNEVRDVTVITGDIHTFFAGVVTTTGRLAGVPAATEFVGGSITSTGIPESFFGQLPREAGIAVGEAFGALNPHIAFTDMRHKGYGVLDCRAEELLVRFEAVPSILERPAPSFTLKRFRVPRGLPVVLPG